MSRDLPTIRHTILSITSFFLIEAKLNKIIDSYDSLDDVWERYMDALEMNFLKYCQERKDFQILEYKKILHFSAMVFRQKGERLLSDETLNMIRLNFKQYYLKASSPVLEEVKKFFDGTGPGFQLLYLRDIEQYSKLSPELNIGLFTLSELFLVGLKNVPF
jgi:hypothetical protein